jgi:hypothetical protein
MKIALSNNDTETMAVAFRNLKACFKFWGILMMIGVAAHGLVWLLAVLGKSVS